VGALRAVDSITPAKAELVRRGLTQVAVARDLGYHPEHFCRVLNGIRPSSPRLRRALSRYLRLPQQELFEVAE
jgi:hypothetical protein